MTKPEIDFRISVKAFIVQNNKLLTIKRVEDNVQKPGCWEVPGGRLEIGEDPIFGLMRETKEETGLYINPKQPLSVRHFTRSDGQIVTLLTFFCKLSGGTLKLSEEHSDYKWIDISSCKETIIKYFHKEIDIIHKLERHNLIDYK